MDTADDKGHLYAFSNLIHLSAMMILCHMDTQDADL